MITAFVAHARNVSVDDRLAFASELREVLHDGGLVLETCHRVEGYAVLPAAREVVGPMALPRGGRRLAGDDAIRHAMVVAVGSDSVVVGEDQVLHQLRETIDAGRRNGLDPSLERLFALALRAGRQARSWRQGPERSLATIALAALESRMGLPGGGGAMLVVGAGRMARLAARAVRAAGYAVVVANRTHPGAEVLAREVSGSVAPFDPGSAVRGYAGVVVALGGPWRIADATAAALAGSVIPVADLSVPPAIEPHLAAELGSRLITADDLARSGAALENAAGDGDPRIQALIDRSTAEYVAWLRGRDSRAAASALARQVEQARELELAALWQRLPELDAESRETIEAMTRHLADRLLREPFERLGRDTDGAADRAVREVFAL